MEAQKTKLFNFRPLFLAFAAMFCGIYFGMDFLFAALKIKILVGALFAAVFVLCFLSRQKAALIIMLCAALLGFGLCALGVKDYKDNMLVKQTLYIEGTVQSCNLGTVYLKDLKNLTTGKAVKGVVLMQNADAEAEKLLNAAGVSRSYNLIGVKVRGRFRLNSFDLCKKGANFDKTKVSSRLVHYAERVYEIEFVKNKPNVFDKIKRDTLSDYYKSMSNDIAGLAYASVFGDTAYLSPDINSLFKAAGVSHLLSVSGLHVSLVIIIIGFMLKKLRAGRAARFTVMSVLLFLYAALCGFSAPVLRTAIMVVVYMAADLLRLEKDNLNTFSIAGLSLLLAFPMFAFNAGFLLSFACILSFSAFLPPLLKAFEKIKLPRAVAQPFGMSLTATFVTFPIVATYFGYAALFSPVANLIIIPVFGFAFCCLFIATVFARLFAFIPALAVVFGLVFKAVAAMFQAILGVVWLCARVPVSSLRSMKYTAIPFYAAMLFACRYCFAHRTVKIIAVCFMFSLCVLAFFM